MNNQQITENTNEDVVDFDMSHLTPENLKSLFEKHHPEKSMSEVDFAIIAKAFDFAKEAHKDQKRNSGEPYFTHVYAAAENCATFGMDANVIAAGLLHDTIEDTDITESEFEKVFGKEITFLVNGVTKLGKLKYKGRERHVESLRKFFIASAEDVRVVIIKLADRLHNLQTLKHVRPDKQKRIALASIDVYAALASRLGMGKLSGEMQDLAFPFAYPEDYEKVNQLLKQRKESDKKYLEKVRKSLLKELAAQKLPDFEVLYRTKGTYSLYKKLKRRDWDMDGVFDIVALRVLLPNLEDCYRVLGIVHSMWRPYPGRIKDWIAIPKSNGYRSLHTTIFTGDGGIAEIQIRTKEMDEIAEYGIASHHAYKFIQGKKKNKQSGFDWIDQLREFQKEELKPSEYMDQLKTDLFEDRIFVFTPQGDVLDLPVGATIVDFAYAIHSDIGNHLSSAKINGQNKAIKTELNNQDVVEILQNKKSKPSAKWLAYAKTSQAQKHIRNATKGDGIMAKFFG